MRIACVGGGPGGLFFASLLRRNRPDAEVVVFERNRPNDTFGFGVVFSDATLGTIDAADPILGSALSELSKHWDKIEVRVHGVRERVGGMGMSAVVRRTLLGLLHDRAESAGVDLRFEHEVCDVGELADFDLVVVCDGANSRFRQRFVADYGPSVETSSAKFIWFGTTYPFEGLSFVHCESRHGAFAAHAYPISDSMSTFIVETDARTWANAELDVFCTDMPAGPSDEKSKSYLDNLFGPEIDGHPLIGNNSRWGSFSTIRMRSWRRGNWVLLGDAAHTAHFSVGSGTKMAMEDAVGLVRALAESSYDMPAALELYEQRRRSSVEKIQDLAQPSLSWWERFRIYTRAFEPIQFGFHFLTRSVTRDKLRSRDHAYVERVDKWWHEHHDAEPLAAQWRARDFRLPARRVSVDSSGALTAHGAWLPMSPFDGRRPGSGVWIEAPPTETGLHRASTQIRQAVGEAVPLIGVCGGTALTRVLVAEEARLVHSVPVVIAGAYDDDAATTLILSGRADLVATVT
ncbi:MAG: FAD-dependent monooxygenase [Actinomycetota bacterium]|nr:FAD-dependent monooxygenase [Actinomycetota bacterium]